MSEQSLTNDSSTPYVGRFAPSPTGPLHMGSLACAMATWADARAHGGTWLIRIEDIDPPRDMPGADKSILEVLAAYGMTSDRPVLWQHTRLDRYEEVFNALREKGAVFGCACSRHEILAADAAMGLPRGVYPGTCRMGTHGKAVRSWRFKVTASLRGITVKPTIGESWSFALSEIVRVDEVLGEGPLSSVRRLTIYTPSRHVTLRGSLAGIEELDAFLISYTNAVGWNDGR